MEGSKLVNDFCITYYRYYKLDWPKWANYKNIKINQTPPDYKDWYSTSVELNNGGAWDVFAHCNNGYNQPVSVLDRWQKAGDITEFAKYTSTLLNINMSPYTSDV